MLKKPPFLVCTTIPMHKQWTLMKCCLYCSIRENLEIQLKTENHTYLFGHIMQSTNTRVVDPCQYDTTYTSENKAIWYSFSYSFIKIPNVKNCFDNYSSLHDNGIAIATSALHYSERVRNLLSLWDKFTFPWWHSLFLLGIP